MLPRPSGIWKGDTPEEKSSSPFETQQTAGSLPGDAPESHVPLLLKAALKCVVAEEQALDSPEVLQYGTVAQIGLYAHRSLDGRGPVIDLPRRTPALAAAHVRHRGGSAGASGSSGLIRLGHSSHSVTKWWLACMSTCRSRPAPELTNLCATPAGTTTTWPPVASITSSPAVKVTLPSCTTKTSS